MDARDLPWCATVLFAGVLTDEAATAGDEDFEHGFKNPLFAVACAKAICKRHGARPRDGYSTIDASKDVVDSGGWKGERY